MQGSALHLETWWSLMMRDSARGRPSISALFYETGLISLIQMLR